MLAYIINRPIDGNKLLRDIQTLISQHKDSPDNKVLSIRIQEIVSEQNLLPLLEHKKE
jgi:hypothetical protein